MKKIALLTAALGVTLMASGCVTTGSSGSGDKVVKIDNTTSFAVNTDEAAPKKGRERGLISGLLGNSGMGSGDEKAKMANDRVIAAALLNAMGGKAGEKVHWTTPETLAKGYVVVGAPNGRDATGASCRPYSIAVTVKDGANVFNRTACGQDDTVLGPLKEIAGDAFKAPAAPEKAKPGKKVPAKPAAK